jgi:hypothetical protein
MVIFNSYVSLPEGMWLGLVGKLLVSPNRSPLKKGNMKLPSKRSERSLRTAPSIHHWIPHHKLLVKHHVSTKESSPETRIGEAHQNLLMAVNECK